MKTKAIPLAFLGGLTFLVVSCDKTTPPPIDYKYGYFPLSIGHEVEYYVDSIIYNPLFPTGRDTTHWQVKEVVESKFIDNLGRDAYRIERYLRANDSAAWFISDVWYAVLEPTRAERIEENLRFVRLVFPPDIGDRWMGNLYISADSFDFYRDWEYEYMEVDEPFSLNSFDFDSTLTVLEVDDSTFIDKRYSKAIYAKNVGLIYKDLYNLEHVDTVLPPPGPWEQKANRGYIVRIRVKNF